MKKQNNNKSRQETFKMSALKHQNEDIGRKIWNKQPAVKVIIVVHSRYIDNKTRLYAKEIQITMEGLKEMLIKEEERLLSIKRVVDNRLINVPEGNLRITSTRKRPQFMHCTDKDNKRNEQGIYIKKENILLANHLAQKSYDQKVKKIVDRRLKQIGRLNKEYKDNELDELYNKLHPIRKTLIEPVELPWEQRL